MTPYIEVMHSGDEWLGRSAVLRPPRGQRGNGVTVLTEWHSGQLHPDEFESRLARLAEITGYAVEYPTPRNVDEASEAPAHTAPFTGPGE